MKGRVGMNRIETIVADNDDILNDEANIASKFGKFYMTLLGFSSKITEIDPSVLPSGSQICKMDG